MDIDGNILLYFVVNLLRFFKWIIRNGGDVNVVNVNGCIFFYCVVFLENMFIVDIMKFLLKVGVDIYCRDN